MQLMMLAYVSQHYFAPQNLGFYDIFHSQIP